MNYEFHVGDYVEDVRGHTGYIKDVSEESNTFTIVWRNYCGTDYTQMRWFDHYAPNRRKWENDFLRIGAYDFTKKEKKKIEQLEKDLPIEMKVGDKIAIIKQYFDGNYNTIIYNTKMIDKINELVDAVNKLRSDYDEHIEAHRQTDR